MEMGDILYSPCQQKTTKCDISFQISMLEIGSFSGHISPYFFFKKKNRQSCVGGSHHRLTLHLIVTAIRYAKYLMATHHPLSRLQSSVRAPVLSLPRSVNGLHAHKRGLLAEQNSR